MKYFVGEICLSVPYKKALSLIMWRNQVLQRMMIMITVERVVRGSVTEIFVRNGSLGSAVLVQTS